jgi:hypothetical protein
MVVFMQLYSACEAFCPTAVGQKGNVRLPKDSPQAKGPPAASAFDMLGVSELALLAVLGELVKDVGFEGASEELRWTRPVSGRREIRPQPTVCPRPDCPRR